MLKRVGSNPAWRNSAIEALIVKHKTFNFEKTEHYRPVAQPFRVRSSIGRAIGSYPIGCWFNSSRTHQSLMEIKTKIILSGAEMKAILSEHIRKTTGKEVTNCFWQAAEGKEQQDKYGTLIITLHCIDPEPKPGPDERKLTLDAL